MLVTWFWDKLGRFVVGWLVNSWWNECGIPTDKIHVAIVIASTHLVTRWAFAKLREQDYVLEMSKLGNFPNGIQHQDICLVDVRQWIEWMCEPPG